MITTQEQLVKQLENQLAILRSYTLERDTHDWYLYNNLEKYLKVVKSYKSASELKKAASVFGSYCTESMNWNTNEYKFYITLAEAGRKLGKLKK
jgi:hypothetical protein